MDGLDEVTSPKAHARVASRIGLIAIVLTVIGLTTLFVLHYSFHIFKKVDAAATAASPTPPPPPENPRVSLIKASQNVLAMDAEIVATAQALKLKADDMKTRTISREDDRREFDRLNNKLIDLKKQRAELVRDFNTNLALHPQPDLAPITSE